jgi:hypothetical protein
VLRAGWPVRPDYSPVPARAGIRSVPKLEQTAMSPLTRPFPIRLDAEQPALSVQSFEEFLFDVQVLTPRALRGIAFPQVFVPHELVYQPVSRR